MLSLELPIKLLCSKYSDLSVAEFFSHYEVAFGEPLNPEKFGFTEKIGLLSKIATELHILEITLTSCGTTKINLTKKARWEMLQQDGNAADDFLCQEDEKKKPVKQRTPDDAALDVHLPTQNLPIHLLEGSWFPIVVTQVENPSRFYFNIFKAEGILYFDNVHNLMDEMDKFYASSRGDDYKIDSWKNLNLGCVIAAKYRDDGYHRASVIRVLPHGMLNLCFVDYGTIDNQKLTKCRYLKEKWTKMPGQAIEAHLYGVVPVNGKKKYSNHAARDKLVELTNISLGTLLAIVQSGVEQSEVLVHDAQGTELYEHRGLALSLIDGCVGEHGLDLGNELVNEGLVDIDAIPARETPRGFPSLSSMDPRKISTDDFKIMARVDEIVKEKDDVFEISDYLKLLRLHEKNLKLVLKEAQHGLTTGEYEQSDIEDINRMLARVKVRKEEQEEMEAADYIDHHIIPNLPPGYNHQEDV